MSSSITFRQVSADEARIYDAEGDYVGDLLCQRDILKSASSFFVIHLIEDPRGPVHVRERERIRAVAEERLRSHPLWQ